MTPLTSQPSALLPTALPTLNSPVAPVVSLRDAIDRNLLSRLAYSGGYQWVRQVGRDQAMSVVQACRRDRYLLDMGRAGAEHWWPQRTVSCTQPAAIRCRSYSDERFPFDAKLPTEVAVVTLHFDVSGLRLLRTPLSFFRDLDIRHETLSRRNVRRATGECSVTIPLAQAVIVHGTPELVDEFVRPRVGWFVGVVAACLGIPGIADGRGRMPVSASFGAGCEATRLVGRQFCSCEPREGALQSHGRMGLDLWQFARASGYSLPVAEWPAS